ICPLLPFSSARVLTKIFEVSNSRCTSGCMFSSLGFLFPPPHAPEFVPVVRQKVKLMFQCFLPLADRVELPGPLHLFVQSIEIRTAAYLAHRGFRYLKFAR